MTPRLIARLCYKSLAVYAVIIAIGHMHFIPTSWVMMSAPGKGWLITAAAGLASTAPFVQLAIGLWLWFKADIVAAWTFGYDIQDDPAEPDRAPVPLSADLVQMIVFSSLGIWVLIGAIPELLSSLAWVVFSSELIGNEVQQRAGRAQSIGATVSMIARLAIGFWLLFGSAGLVRVLRRFRNVGLENPESPVSPPDDPGPDSAT